MRRMFVAAWAAAVVCSPGVGLAQQPSPVAPVTLLHLAATGTVQVAPDQLVADLVAESTSTSVADAQRSVNAAIAHGMSAVKSVAGIDARAIGYQVAPVDPPRSRWQAQQTLELRGSDGPALLDVVNKLQQQGFVTASLEWQVSPARRRMADAEATTAALKALQERMASAAATLGLRIGHIRDVQLQAGGFRPVRPMAAMAARVAGPPPQATAAAEDVTAEVSAEVELLPKQPDP